MCVTIHYQTIPGKLYVTPHNDAFVTYKLRVGTYSKVIAKIHPCSMLNEYLRSQSDVCSVLKYQFSASFHRQASGMLGVRDISFMGSNDNHSHTYMIIIFNYYSSFNADACSIADIKR